MARGWMNHPVLKTNEPYTKAMAWCWLIENAAWKSHDRIWRHDRPAIELKRGQVLAAYRLMAEKWLWSKDRVVRFLSTLKNARMIDVKVAPGINVITILNYDDYQLEPNFNKDGGKDAGEHTDKDAGKDNKNTGFRIQDENKGSEYKPPVPRKRGNGQGELIENLPKQFKEPCRFESEFWPLSVRRENKKLAKASYEKAREIDSQSNIIAGMRAYRRQYENDDRPAAEKDQFYQHTFRWLKNERWREFIEKQQIEADDDKMPEGMTPAQHAAWCLKRAGHV